MRFKRVNDASELGVFKDVVDLQVVDNKIEAITLKHNGEELRIVRGETYSNDLKMMMQEPMVEVTKYRLSGTVGGMMPIVAEEFADENSALRKKETYEDKFYNVGTTLVVEPFIALVEPTKV